MTEQGPTAVSTGEVSTDEADGGAAPRSFSNEQMIGATFEYVDLSESTLNRVDFTRATLRSIDFADTDMRNVALAGTRIRGAYLAGVEIWGEVDGLAINGVDVGPLVEAELSRLHPERAKLHPTDAAGFREAWAVLDELWSGTVERARRLAAVDPALLHEGVEDEWSFIQTLRHLPFATSSWLSRGIQGDPSPWHPLELPYDEMRPTPGVPHDRDARPSLDEALTLRHDRFDRVRSYLSTLTDEQLADQTITPEGVGWPPAGEAFPVKEGLDTLLNEEWWHRRFAERDLATLEVRLTTNEGGRHTEEES